MNISPSVYQSLRSGGSCRDLYYVSPKGELSVKTAPRIVTKWHAFLPACNSFYKIKRCIREYLQETIQRVSLSEEKRLQWQTYLKKHCVETLFNQIFVEMDQGDWSWDTQLDQAEWHEVGSSLEESRIEARKRLLGVAFRILPVPKHLCWHTSPDSLQRLVVNRNLCLHAEQQKARYLHALEQNKLASLPLASAKAKSQLQFQMCTPPASEILGVLATWASDHFLEAAGIEGEAKTYYQELSRKIALFFRGSLSPNYFVALTPEGVFGGLVLYSFSCKTRPDVVVDYLIVNPCEQRKKIGVSLLSMVLFQSRLKGLRGDLTLQSTDEARSFYQAQGFEVMEETTDPEMKLSADKAHSLMKKHFGRYLTPTETAVQKRFEKAAPLIRQLQALETDYDSSRAHRLLAELQDHVMLSHFLEEMIRKHEASGSSATSEVEKLTPAMVTSCAD